MDHIILALEASQLDIIALILITLVIVIAFRRLESNERINEEFFKLLLLVGVQLILKLLGTIISGIEFEKSMNLSSLIYGIGYVLTPYVAITGLNFLSVWLEGEEKNKNYQWIYMYIPMIVNFVMVIISLFTGWIFSVNEQNELVLGPLRYFSLYICYIYFVVSLYVLYRNRHNILKEEWLPLIGISVCAVIFTQIRVKYFGETFVWSVAAFAIVVIYIIIQQRMITLDVLTGVWERNSFIHYIENRVATDSHIEFGIILLNIRSLWIINEKYGYGEGNYTIKKCVEILKSINRDKQIMGRISGNEFAIYLEFADKEQLEKKVRNLELRVKEHNSYCKKPYKLECYFEYEIYGENDKNAERFLNQLQYKLYSNKMKKYLIDPYTHDEIG